MSKRKKNIEPEIRCIVYLSTEGDMNFTEQRENKQLRYISEYAKAHNIKIVKKMHRDVLGQNDVNKHFNQMVEMIRKGNADGIIVANMMCISKDVPDAYFKVGMVHNAGGVMVTVDEGRLSMKIVEVNKNA